MVQSAAPGANGGQLGSVGLPLMETVVPISHGLLDSAEGAYISVCVWVCDPTVGVWLALCSLKNIPKVGV